MALVKHTGLKDYLNKAGPDGLPAFFLAGGENFLVRECLDILKKALLAPDEKGFGLETVDGKTTPMGDIVEQVTTFSFLMNRKVVVVKDAPLFSAGTAPGEISYGESDLDLLAGIMEKGIPRGHFLVLTTTGLDRRKKIYKTLEKGSLIIDCTVPQGARKADLDAQRAILDGIAQNALAISGKRIDPPAFSLLLDLTGFNPDLFARNLEKLEDYSGNERRITLDHVRAVVKRDKKDPIFSLTNALLDRNPGQALFFLSSLFSDGFHPLQILKSFENQVRKLLLVKSFSLSLSSGRPGIAPDRMNFNQFKQQIMPAVEERDRRVKEENQAREAFLAGDTPKPSKKKTGAAADLLLAPNPKSPYPVFQTFQKSVKFSLDELRCALMALGDLDYALKSSAMDAETGIENFVIGFCRRGGFAPCSEKQR